MGVEIRDGRAETAPTLDCLEAVNLHWEEAVRSEDMKGHKGGRGKKVRFDERVAVRKIRATGKMKKIVKTGRKAEPKELACVAGGDVPRPMVATPQDVWSAMLMERGKSWADEADDEDEKGEGVERVHC